MRQCRESQVRRFIFASSGGTVYGVPAETPTPETHATHPISLYGAEKLAAEQFLAVLRSHGLESITVRPANVYGPHQDPRGRCGFIAVAMGCALTGREVTVWGDGSTVRDYVYVDDLCDALVRLAYAPTREYIYNVGSGVGISLSQILERIGSIASCTLRVSYAPKQSVDIPVSVLSSERITHETGWAPSVSLREGMGRTWAWLRAAGMAGEPPGTPPRTEELSDA
jgi:UDP-glucose 4-epimerase